MYSFWGRRPNIELQLPFIRRILAENPNAEFHAFNLARDRSDYFYLTNFFNNPEPRITIHQEFFHTRPHWLGYHEVYRYFTFTEFRDCVFVKFDDDVVFMQTDRFGALIDAVQANPGTIVSADVINNGACSVHQPGLCERFEATGIRLLDWHLHAATAAMAHQHFFQRGPRLLRQKPKLIPTEDWLSINMIGYDWRTAVTLGEIIGTRSPAMIAGRGYRPDRDRLGDEGAANTLPRAILHGFSAAHLSFGPQQVDILQLQAWREAYKRIADAHLSGGAWPPATRAEPIYLPPKKRSVALYEITRPCKYANADGVPVFHDTVGAIVELDEFAAWRLGDRVRPVPQPPRLAPPPAARRVRKRTRSA